MVRIAVPAAEQVRAGVRAALVALFGPAVIEPLERHGVVADEGAVVRGLCAPDELARRVHTAARLHRLRVGVADRVEHHKRVRRRPAVNEDLSVDGIELRPGRLATPRQTPADYK